MKVVHITKLPDGGASWCAKRISNALKSKGISSKMILMQGFSTNDISIASKNWKYKCHTFFFIRILYKILKILLRPKYELYKSRRKRLERFGKVFFTSPITDYTSLHNHPFIQDADIVHLHWIADFVDFNSFFKNVNKPIVWTAHDENPGLGGFHYVLQKETASSEFLALDKKYENIKKKAMDGSNSPYLVAISNKMYGFLKNSEILKKCNVTLIHNGVEGDVYKMLDKDTCREELNLSRYKKVFLFSSYSIEDKRKGLTLLIRALEMLQDEDIVLVCIGGYREVPMSKIPIVCTNLITDNDLLSKYYSAADYFVLPSFQEAFAQTPLEAMSCGTPVVAFPCSGIPELINEENGVICEDFTVEALSDGLYKALNKNFIRNNIRKDVLARFSYDIIAEQYIELYNNLLDKKQ